MPYVLEPEDNVYRIGWSADVELETGSESGDDEIVETRELWTHVIHPEGDPAPYAEIQSNNEENINQITPQSDHRTQSTVSNLVMKYIDNLQTIFTPNLLIKKRFADGWTNERTDRPSRDARMHLKSVFKCILQDSHEIPRVIKDGVNCNKKTAAFAIGATGRFWVQYGLQGVNERT